MAILIRSLAVVAYLLGVALPSAVSGQAPWAACPAFAALPNTIVYCYPPDQVARAVRRFPGHVMDPIQIVSQLTGLRLARILIEISVEPIFPSHGSPSINYVFGAYPYLAPPTGAPAHPAFLFVRESQSVRGPGRIHIDTGHIIPPVPPPIHSVWVFLSTRPLSIDFDSNLPAPVLLGIMCRLIAAASKPTSATSIIVIQCSL